VVLPQAINLTDCLGELIVIAQWQTQPLSDCAFIVVRVPITGKEVWTNPQCRLEKQEPCQVLMFGILSTGN